MASAIEQEIHALHFPQDIRTTACEVYNMLDMPTVPRKIKRSKVKCYCVFQAYNELQRPFIPDAGFIGNQLGLDITNSNLSISKRPKYKEGYSPKSVTRTPQFMLRSYIQEYMPLPEDLMEDMLGTFNNVLSSTPRLLLEQAKPLVAAYIMAYTELNGMSANMTDLASVLFIRESSIRSLLETLRSCVMEHI